MGVSSSKNNDIDKDDKTNYELIFANKYVEVATREKLCLTATTNLHHNETNELIPNKFYSLKETVPIIYYNHYLLY